MKIRLSLLAFLITLPALAGTVTPTWTFTDFGLDALTVKKMRVTPIAPYGTNGSGIITGDWRERTTDTNGSVTLTNIANGYSYRVEFSGPWAKTSFTNSFSGSVTGAVNAVDYISSTLISDAGLVAYSKLQANGLFLTKTNSAMIGTPTVNGTNLVSLVSGGGTSLTLSNTTSAVGLTNGMGGIGTNTAHLVGTNLWVSGSNALAVAATITNSGRLTDQGFVKLATSSYHKVKKPYYVYSPITIHNGSTNVNETNILTDADSLIANGFTYTNDLYGYKGVDLFFLDEPLIDHTNGNTILIPSLYPRGLSYLVTNLHNRGFKVGFFMPVGTNSYMTNYPGSANYLEQDALWLATNGVDVIHLVNDDGSPQQYQKMRRVMNEVRKYGAYDVDFTATVNLSPDTGGGQPLESLLDDGLMGQFVNFGPGFSDGLGTTVRATLQVAWWDYFGRSRFFGGCYPIQWWMGSGYSYAQGTHSIDVSKACYGISGIYHNMTSIANPNFNGSEDAKYGYQVMTNRLLRRINGDSGQHFPVILSGPSGLSSTNTLSGTNIFKVALNDFGVGAIAVAIWNRSTNYPSTNTTTVSWATLGIPNGTNTVTDVWTQVSSTVSSNTISADVPAEGMALYVIAPYTPTAAGDISTASSNNLVAAISTKLNTTNGVATASLTISNVADASFGFTMRGFDVNDKITMSHLCVLDAVGVTAGTGTFGTLSTTPLSASQLLSGILPDGVATNNAHTNWSFLAARLAGNTYATNLTTGTLNVTGLATNNVLSVNSITDITNFPSFSFGALYAWNAMVISSNGLATSAWNNQASYGSIICNTNVGYLSNTLTATWIVSFNLGKGSANNGGQVFVLKTNGVSTCRTNTVYVDTVRGAGFTEILRIPANSYLQVYQDAGSPQTFLGELNIRYLAP